MWRSIAILLVLVAGEATAFLATPLNISDPDLIGILCPGEGETRDHEWITREAIRRNIRDFFLKYPPAPDFVVSENATLTELFHSYYGPTSSPTRFIKAVNSITAANVKADSLQQYRYDPAIQGDGERLAEVQSKLTARYPKILTSILRDQAYSAARSLLGTSLHTLQKFYSHSTWIEQGHDDILKELGIPGYVLDGLAGEEEDVCVPCPNPEGCDGNVLVKAGLSTGYYVYPDDIGSDYLIPKPSTGGKCSHGGSLDTSRSEPAIGGINKDTSYPCFSPHHHLHLQAADLAVKATQYYLDRVLDAVGADMYRRFYDLYEGSALSICIDTTGSMDDDIRAVQEQVAEIVANSHPELYILAPFNDPQVGPLLVTDNAQEFLDAINALVPGGGGDEPELFWAGLQLALSGTPEYGDIFCFTDAHGKDGKLMESLISLAQTRNNKVTTILSDLLGKEGSEGDIITGVEEYQRLADSTGGLLINTNKFDVHDIVNIIGGGVESSTVNIINLVGISGKRLKVLPVDDSIVDLQVQITGAVNTAVLTDAKGITYNLMDQASLEAADNVEVVSYTNTFRAIKWTSPSYGLWNLTTNGPTSYSVEVFATSPLDFLAEFSVLDPSPPHPHYRHVTGRPLMNTVYYLELTLVGYLEGHVEDLDSIYFLDMKGYELRNIIYRGNVSDHMYIRTEPLPEESFFVCITGHLKTGNQYERVQVVLVTPVETSVEVWATSEDLSARPGETATAKFIVRNFGLESYFGITGTDDLGFLTSVDPKRTYLGTNETVEVVAVFTVPIDALPGQVSTVIITAQSETQVHSVNSAVTNFVVLASENDTTVPTCIMMNLSDCGDYLYNGVCSKKNWVSESILQDTDSGLYQVRANPDTASMDVIGFTPGTRDQVQVTYASHCCNTEVEVIGVDGQGNVGKCLINMGSLQGLIYDFEVESAGNTHVVLHWYITPTPYPIYHYDLQIDDFFVHQSICEEEFCQEYVNYLEPCKLHTFSIVPTFNYHGEQLAGLGAYTKGYTLFEDPTTPYNGTEVDRTETTISISWATNHSYCTFLYQVCYYEVDTDPTKATCVTTTDTSYTLNNLGECKAYIIDVVAESSSGVQSRTLQFYSVTLCPDAA